MTFFRSLPRKSLVVLTALAGMVLLPCLFSALAAPAHAGGVFEAKGLVELLPAGEVVGDGKTPVKFSMLALKSDGAAMSGLKAKVQPTGGVATALKEVGSGLYEFSFVPPAITAARTVELTLKGKTPDKLAVSKVYSVDVIPPPSHQLTVSATPPELVLGQDASSTLGIQLSAAADEDLSDVELVVQASSGAVANLTDLGGGRYSALYTPPQVNYPHLALLTVVDRQDPTRTYGFIAIPLVGKTAYPVTSTPNSSLMLKVGDRDFGPVQADASGRANIPIMVPPGIKAAMLTTAVGTDTRTEAYDLKVPETKRIKLFPFHAGIPGDRALAIPVRLAVTDPQGAASADAQVSISASVGTVSAPVHEGNGIYRADYTPPATMTMSQVAITASLPGSPGVQTDKATVPIVPVRPASVSLVAEPSVLPEGATGFKALVKVAAPDGIGMIGRQLVFAANGAELHESVKDLKGGEYQGLFDITGSGPVELSVTVQSTPTGNPFRQLVLLPTVDRLPNDGLSSAMLTVVAVDEFGYPVANVPLTFELLSGAGSLPPSATTNAAGLAQIYYTAGRAAGLANIKVTSGAHSAGAGILQAPAEVASDLKMVRSGSEATFAQIAAWSAIVQTMRIAREGQAAVVPVPVPAAAEHGELAALAVSTASVSAGATTTVLVKATDAQGRGVPGQTLQFMVSAGTVGAVADQGNGDYQVPLTVPAGHTAAINIAVSSADGKASTFGQISIGGEAPSVWGAPPPVAPEPTPAPAPVVDPFEEAVAPAPEPTPAPEPAPEPEKEREPRDPGDHNWLLVRAAMGTAGYRYNYDVNATPRNINADGNPTPFGQSLELSGDEAAVQGTGDAVPLSIPVIDFRVMGWLPMFQYVGLEARYRGMWFGVQTDSFTEDHPGVDMSWYDNFLTVTGQARYYHDVGENRFWLGAHGGIVYTAVPVVAFWTPEGQSRGLWFFDWGFTSFYGGVRGGADLGFGLSAVLGGAWGTEGYSGVFCSDIDVELSYEVINHLTVNLGYNRLSRDVIIPETSEGDDTGNMVELIDLRSGVYFGLGAAF